MAATSSKRGAVPLHKAKGDRILAAAIESLDRQDAAAAARASAVEEVHVKGTGKAVEKVLAVAGWLQDRAAEEGVRVMLETGSWWAVDDVEVVDKEDFEAEDTVGNARNGMEIDKEDQNEENGRREDIPDSRLRSVSVLTLRVAVL